MIDRTPLLRFLSPAVLAGHVALAGSGHAFAGDPAPVVRRTSLPPSPADAFRLACPPPTQRRSPLTLAVLRIVRSGCPSTSRGSTPRVLIGTLRRVAARRCIDPCRARRGSCAVRSLGRRSATALRATWPGRVPFGGEAFLGFRPVIDLGRNDLASRPQFHACDGVAFDAFPDGTRGVSDIAPFAGLLPPCGCVARFHRREPTCRLPVHRSQCSCCAIGRPGDIKWAPFVVP